MGSTWAQRVFAGHWPLMLWLAAGTIGGGVWVVRESGVTWGTLGVGGAAWLVGAMVLGMGVGFLIAAATAWEVVGPMYRVRVWMNGGPFVAGDEVEVVGGPHRGRVGRVCRAGQGDSVVVEIVGGEGEGFEGVFCGVQLRRVGERGRAGVRG